MNSNESLVIFLNNMFDEAILIGLSEVDLTASVLRSLRMAFGDEAFNSLIKELISAGKLKWMGDIDELEGNGVVAKLLDYI